MQNFRAVLPPDPQDSPHPHSEFLATRQKVIVAKTFQGKKQFLTKNYNFKSRQNLNDFYFSNFKFMITLKPKIYLKVVIFCKYQHFRYRL